MRNCSRETEGAAVANVGPIVLAFYPLDFSPTCTQENECFREDLGKFNELGAQVLGISVDSAWTHRAFAEALRLSFPLLADFHPKGAVAKLYEPPQVSTPSSPVTPTWYE